MVDFTKMFIRQNHPDFLDLPWDVPLSLWKSKTDRIVELERGTSRHQVVFVVYGDNIYAIKELPPKIGEREYRILRRLEEQELPAVKAVGYAIQETSEQVDNRSIVITEYLDALPYRSLFMKSGLERYQNQLLDALAVLFVQLHLQGFFWGDCSLSNILFRRDASELQAYLVDAETSTYHKNISDGKRNQDIMIAKENIAAGLMDISNIIDLPDFINVYEVGKQIEHKYISLWNEINKVEIFGEKETYKIQERIRKINNMGFSIEEIELVKTADGNQIKMKTIVTDRNYHQEQLHQLTGILAEETQARVILNGIRELRVKLSEKQNRAVSLKQAAFHWTYEKYLPTLKSLELMYNSKKAPKVYCDILEHKWFLSVEAKTDVGLEFALNDYKKRFLDELELKERI